MEVKPDREGRPPRVGRPGLVGWPGQGVEAANVESGLVQIQRPAVNKAVIGPIAIVLGVDPGALLIVGALGRHLGGSHGTRGAAPQTGLFEGRGERVVDDQSGMSVSGAPGNAPLGIELEA